MTDGRGAGPAAHDGCGCCGDVITGTPLSTENPPGRSALAYRVGTWAEFRASMVAALSRTDAAEPTLTALTTRASDDFAIALYDAFACTLDVLTFYSERAVSEYFVRTATERRSLLELALAIGYELGPGVAASTHLAFAMDDAPGAPAVATNPAGSKVQSVPEPGQQPQTFETSAQIEARVAWNAMRPRQTIRHPIMDGAYIRTTFLVEGAMTGLRVNDGVIVLPEHDDKPVFCLITSVTVQAARGRTEIAIQQVPTSMEVLIQTNLSAVLKPVSYSAQAGLANKVTGALTGGVATTAAAAPSASSAASKASGAAPAAKAAAPGAGSAKVSGVALNMAAAVLKFGVGDYLSNLLATRRPPPGIMALRTRAAIFGHNAPSLTSLPNSLTGYEYVYMKQTDGTYEYAPQAGPYVGRTGATWAEGTLKSNHIQPDSSRVYLDTTYPGIAADSYVVLRDTVKHHWAVHRVTAAGDQSVADFALTGKVTRLDLDNGSDFGDFTIRGTTVYGQSDVLPLARLPITDDVHGATIEVEGGIAGLFAGQTLIVRGEAAADRGITVAEVAVIRDVQYPADPDDADYTVITLRDALARAYVRETVTIYGNVVPATHGETKHEVLGSGDASRAFQRFTLRQSPLTYTSAATPSGIASTLQVFVNDIRWQEVASLYGHGPREQVYAVRRDDDGRATVLFGDGLAAGARLPTGRDNVREVLRTGIGVGGLAKADQISTLMSRPAGVRSATNPLPASGADAPETLEMARQTAPLHVRTLDRIVSLRDYEDFAQAFAGIGRALATWTWDGQRRGIMLTVAGPLGADIADDGPIRASLLDAIARAGDPYIPVVVRSYGRQLFRLAADVTVAPDALPEQVEAAIRPMLEARYSFAARDFGQPVALSEVVGAIQAVRGVVGVNVRALYRSFPAGDPPEVHQRLVAALPRQGLRARETVPAELLMLAPGGADLAVSR
jgi:hypothetical protein